LSAPRRTPLLLFITLLLIVIGPVQGRASGEVRAVVAGSGPRAAAPRVSMAAADYANRRVDYRVVGAYVQRSTDGGRHWTLALDPGGHPLLGVGFLVWLVR